MNGKITGLTRKCPLCKSIDVEKIIGTHSFYGCHNCRAAFEYKEEKEEIINEGKTLSLFCPSCELSNITILKQYGDSKQWKIEYKCKNCKHEFNVIVNKKLEKEEEKEMLVTCKCGSNNIGPAPGGRYVCVTCGNQFDFPEKKEKKEILITCSNCKSNNIAPFAMGVYKCVDCKFIFEFPSKKEEMPQICTNCKKSTSFKLLFDELGKKTWKCEACGYEFVLIKEEVNRGASPFPPILKVTEFSSGAVRAAEKLRGDLVCPQAFITLAEVCYEGEIKYGARNWEKGIPNSNLVGHAIIHLCKFLLGDKEEDHLGHALWNVHAIIHNEKCGKRHGE